MFISESRSFYRCGNPGSLSSVVKRPDKKLQSQFSSICAQIAVLLSMEKSEQTKGIVKYLQDSFFYLYPDNMDLVTKARQMAHDLGGGSLSLPRLGWKYAWIKELFGWKVAKNICFAVPGIKTTLKVTSEKLHDRFSTIRPVVRPRD